MVMPDRSYANGAQDNEYRCPAGKALRSEWRPFKNSRTHITKAQTDYLSIKPTRLCGLLDERSLLPEHTVAQDCAQRP
jgi:hypothetical protein